MYYNTHLFFLELLRQFVINGTVLYYFGPFWNFLQPHWIISAHFRLFEPFRTIWDQFRAVLPQLESSRLNLSRTWAILAARQNGQTFFTPDANKTRGAKYLLKCFHQTTSRRNSEIPLLNRLSNNCSIFYAF